MRSLIRRARSNSLVELVVLVAVALFLAFTVQAYAVNPDDNGLERFSTATRRQNFLVPPRRHRAFPLLELT